MADRSLNDSLDFHLERNKRQSWNEVTREKTKRSFILSFKEYFFPAKTYQDVCILEGEVTIVEEEKKGFWAHLGKLRLFFRQLFTRK